MYPSHDHTRIPIHGLDKIIGSDPATNMNMSASLIVQLCLFS